MFISKLPELHGAAKKDLRFSKGLSAGSPGAFPKNESEKPSLKKCVVVVVVSGAFFSRVGYVSG